MRILFGLLLALSLIGNGILGLELSFARQDKSVLQSQVHRLQDELKAKNEPPVTTEPTPSPEPKSKDKQKPTSPQKPAKKQPRNSPPNWFCKGHNDC